ncbi:MAG TPA: carboxypeptidase-like regulatory domain-containing protein [archaeon]|nr:carboxypeptidase-like regulatory domain-containing protein [archaeon]
MNEKDEEVEKIYNMLKGRENRFSKEELEKLIIFDGYDKDVAKRVVDKLYDNKQKEEKIITTPEEKEKILKEISKSLKEDTKEKPSLVAPKKDKKNIFLPIITFFKKIYFFFENLYYSMIDGINKVIPIGKLVDKIDKVFPSFILFIIFIFALIWLIFFSGIFSGLMGSPVLEVTVTDILDMPVSGATAILSIGDINKTSQTGVFGEAIFEDFGKKKNVKLIVEKESYNTQTKELKLKGRNNSVLVKLEIDTNLKLHLMNPTTRNLVFKENDILLATKPIRVNLRCANSGTTPDPSSKSTSTGQLSVSVPAGCGDLRVDVYSEFYNSIQNRLVPESNVIMLTPIAQNYGTLEITVKDQNTQVAIPDVYLQLYRPDDPTTQINESNIFVSSGTTTIYGTYVFTNLTPGAYTVSASKEGYVSTLDRFGPYQVSINNNTTGNVLLTTGGKTLNVVLVDANGNTEREIRGDITIYTKRTDTNLVKAVGTREDTNKATFSLPVASSVTYRISVTNTENYGYFAPDIINLNSFDNNATITVPLEYSSELNTGKIGVNVSRSAYNVVGASVYIFRDGDDDIPIAGPQITNSSGDCNFSFIRSGRKYYAYAIKSPEQGISQTERLDANEFMELDVELEDQATILNLKVTPTIDYNIYFFKSNGDEITNYVVAGTSQDSNKEYIFNEFSQNIYAIITADGKSTYQTSLITLIPGQKVYRTIALSNTRTEAFSNIELLGIYDESGNIDKNIINLATEYSKTFKLKFKLTTNKKENRDRAYAYVRAGKRVALPSDYLRLEKVIAFNSENEYGCNFSGETAVWDPAHFLANNDIDHSQTNCSASTSGFKWVKIDFSDTLAEQIEFFVDVKFQNGITNLSDYVIYYKGLTETKDNEYKLSPNLSTSWQECDMVPDGYFYSPYHSRALTFNNSDYMFLYDIYDYNLPTNTVGQKLTPLGSKYILEIGKNYYYSQKLLYLKNNTINGSVVANSVNTYNHLIYNAYKFKKRNHSNNTQTDINATGINAINYTINDIDATLATQIDHSSVISATDFFINNTPSGFNQHNNNQNNHQNNNLIHNVGMASATLYQPNNDSTSYDLNTDSNITTDILNISGLNPYSVPVLAYYPTDANVIIEIITGDTTENNDIYAGDNIISFRVRNISGSPISGVKISAVVNSPQTIVFGTTNSNGMLENKNLSLPLTKLGHNIYFSFLFPANYGLSNNTVTISKQVKSNYRLFLENGTEISSRNTIVYNIGKYTYNGNFKFTKDLKKYYIKGTNQVYGWLIAADPYPNPTQYLDYQDINNYIYTENNIPLYLSDLNKEIKTRISILDLPNGNGSTPPQDPKGPSVPLTEDTTQDSDIASVTGGYHNIINAGNYNNQPIRLDLNAPFKTNLFFNLNLNTSYVDLPKPGIKVSTEDTEDLIIELIKNRNSSVNFNLNIENGSNKPLFANVTPIINESLNGYITITSNNLNIAPNTSEQLFITIDLNNSKIINPDLRNEPLTININYTLNGITFTETIETKISLFDSNDAFVITQPTIKTMDCTSSNCTSEMIVSATNKTRTYDFNLTSINMQQDDNLSINVSSPQLPITIDSQNVDNTKKITLNVIGNYDSLKGSNNSNEYIRVIEKEINKTIKYEYKIIGINQSQSFDTIKNTKFKISVWLQNLQELLRENGLYGNICLGVGGINIDESNNFYILGNCDTENLNDCKNGENAKLKIIYDWTGSTNWKEKCIENTLEGYDETKTHCDSLQMLFSVFNLINTSGTSINNKYIYLMSDGVTKDLLSDFVNHDEFMGAVNTNWDNYDLLSDANINADKFTVSKIEIDSSGNEVKTLKPGKYRITINEEFSVSKPTPLHIKLELVREMPYTMRNLLYYIPIDGDLGIVGNEQNKRSARVGYGSSLTQDSQTPLPVQIGDQKEYFIYPTANDENKSRAIITLQNDADNFKNTLRSEGKLLDLILTNIDPDDQSFNIDMTYSPSYPIPLYAKVVNSNVSGFSYKLRKGETQNITIAFANFLVWQDYNNENKTLADGQYYSSAGSYLKSMIDGKKFESVYGNNNNIKLIKTMMYWPMNYYAKNISDIYLVLSDSGSNCCGNNPGSKIYYLVNLEGSTTTDNIKSMTRVGNLTTNTVSLNSLLNYINNDACIRSGLTVTTIKWIDENVGFTQEQIDQIIENSGVLGNSDNPTTDIIK